VPGRQCGLDTALKKRGIRLAANNNVTRLFADFLPDVHADQTVFIDMRGNIKNDAGVAILDIGGHHRLGAGIIELILRTGNRNLRGDVDGGGLVIGRQHRGCGKDIDLVFRRQCGQGGRPPVRLTDVVHHPRRAHGCAQQRGAEAAAVTLHIIPLHAEFSAVV